MVKIILTLLWFMPTVALGQDVSTKSVQYDSFRLKSTEPSVYVSYEKAGRRSPRYIGESNEGIWLRFHNNTKANVTIKTFGVAPEHGDYGVFYEIHRVGKDDENSNRILPKGYRMGHISSVISLKSGESFVFSVPTEHLAEELYLEIEYSYDWEQNGSGGGGGYIRHKALFFSSSLP